MSCCFCIHNEAETTSQESGLEKSSCCKRDVTTVIACLFGFTDSLCLSDRGDVIPFSASSCLEGNLRVLSMVFDIDLRDKGFLLSILEKTSSASC